MNLNGRIVLVTGAGRRVGRAIAQRLARDGCRLAIHYHTSQADAEETADHCRDSGAAAVELFQEDLADPEGPDRLAKTVIDRLGGLDVLINNASVFETMRLDEFTLAAWERALRVNLTAPMALTFAARDALRRARGRVVMLCDVSTARPWPDHLAYMASKGGLDTLTRALARSLAPEVNVVGVAPGVAAWPDDYDQALRDRLTARIPLRRAGTPEDVAAAVHFLLAEGDYITGTILPVDGGRHVV